MPHLVIEGNTDRTAPSSQLHRVWCWMSSPSSAVQQDGAARKVLVEGAFEGEHLVFVLAQDLDAGELELVERLGPVGGFDEPREARRRVVLEVLVVGDGQDVVRVGHEGHVRGVGHLGQVVLHGVARVGEHQAVDVQRVAAEHAAHGVGDEAHDLVALGAHVLVALVALGDLLGRVEDARHRDVFVLDLDGDLALHVVDAGEDTVELLLVVAELLEAVVDLLLVRLVVHADEPCHAKPPFYMESKSVWS